MVKEYLNKQSKPDNCWEWKMIKIMSFVIGTQLLQTKCLNFLFLFLFEIFSKIRAYTQYMCVCVYTTFLSIFIWVSKRCPIQHFLWHPLPPPPPICQAKLSCIVTPNKWTTRTHYCITYLNINSVMCTHRDTINLTLVESMCI